MKFSELQLNANVLEALDAMRFDECTPIQEQAIPIILEGKDLIAVAQTGTGKTAAFLLPVLNKLSEGNHPEDAINCIIMSPTRELAQQIDQQMEGFSYFMPVSSVAVYGGNDGILFEQQKKGLTLGADVVIATPGRPFIGRKGIGKLALLSCAKRITVITKTENTDIVGGVIDNSGLDEAIKDDVSANEFRFFK